MELLKKLYTEKTSTGNRLTIALFLCPLCEKTHVRPMNNGKRQKTCGCCRNNYNGESNTRIFKTWEDMVGRCTNQKHASYSGYGGRGISLCEEWGKSFFTFKDWALKNSYSDKLQIDRIDNNKGYYPENCRFATNKQNVRNRNNNKLSLPKAELMRSLYKNCKIKQVDLARMFGVHKSVVWRIIHNDLWAP